MGARKREPENMPDDEARWEERLRRATKSAQNAQLEPRNPVLTKTRARKPLLRISG